MRRLFLKTEHGYDIEYGYGRTADVVINGVAVEVVPVRDYDFATGKFGPEPTETQIRKRVAEFLDPEDMGNYWEMARSHR